MTKKMKMIREYKDKLLESNNVNNVIANKDILKDSNLPNIQKKKSVKLMFFKKIQIKLFSIITLILCIVAISLLSQHNLYSEYINYTYIILGVAFGTFLFAFFNTIILKIMKRKIMLDTKNKYNTLNNLMKNGALKSNINEYNLGIQMALESKIKWEENNHNIKWNPFFIIAGINIFFKDLKENIYIR